jgi:hypothetical protein
MITRDQPATPPDRHLSGRYLEARSRQSGPHKRLDLTSVGSILGKKHAQNRISCQKCCRRRRLQKHKTPGLPGAL